MSSSRTRERCACPAFLPRLFRRPRRDHAEQGIAEPEPPHTSAVSRVCFPGNFSVPDQQLQSSVPAALLGLAADSPHPRGKDEFRGAFGCPGFFTACALQSPNYCLDVWNAGQAEATSDHALLPPAPCPSRGRADQGLRLQPTLRPKPGAWTRSSPRARITTQLSSEHPRQLKRQMTAGLSSLLLCPSLPSHPHTLGPPPGEWGEGPLGCESLLEQPGAPQPSRPPSKPAAEPLFLTHGRWRDGGFLAPLGASACPSDRRLVGGQWRDGSGLGESEEERP